MLVSAVTSAVAEILQDANNVTWTLPQLVAWTNDAQRAAVMVRPDIATVSVNKQLVSGTEQSLSDATDLRLISVDLNMGPDGATKGKAIRLVDKKTKDAYSPDWHTETADIVVKEYMFDDARPLTFWVSPPVHATTPVFVRLFKAVSPTDAVDQNSTLFVKDVYATALIEWVCYRAFSRDSEETPNWQRAARHFAAFFNLLQIKMQADMAINPKVRELVNK